MPARYHLVATKLQQYMKSITLTFMIIAFAGIANAQNCNNEFKATAGIQDIGNGEMSPIMGFNYSLMGGKNAFGGFIEAKYLNAETVCWIGGAYQTHFGNEFSHKEFESKIGVGTRTDSTTEFFFGGETKIQFPYFVFSVGGEFSPHEETEYKALLQYAMCPNFTYFGIVADSYNGYGIQATQVVEIKNSILFLNCGVMSNSFDSVVKEDFSFFHLDPMIQMAITYKF